MAHQQPHRQPPPRKSRNCETKGKVKSKVGSQKGKTVMTLGCEGGQKERYERLVRDILNKLEREGWIYGGQIRRAKLPEDIFYFFGSVFHQIKLKGKISRAEFIRLCQREYTNVNNQDISQLLAAQEETKPYHCNPEELSPFNLLPSIQPSKFSQFLQANKGKEKRREEGRRVTEEARSESNRLRELSVKVGHQLKANAIRLADHSRVIQELM